MTLDDITLYYVITELFKHAKASQVANLCHIKMSIMAKSMDL